MNLAIQKQPRNTQALFTRIARRYDLMNRLMTFGQDARWRRETIQRAHLHPGARFLDLGTGTGDLTLEALRQEPASVPASADFTMEMMRVGQKRGTIPYLAADATLLPFSSQTFDAIVSGFLVRNLFDVPQSLREQWRALKPGGRIVILDTTRPTRSIYTPFIWIHTHIILPLLAWLIAGNRKAYAYLTQSTENFLRAEELAALMKDAGFQNVDFRRIMFGMIAIHWGEK